MLKKPKLRQMGKVLIQLDATVKPQSECLNIPESTSLLNINLIFIKYLICC